AVGVSFGLQQAIGEQRGEHPHALIGVGPQVHGVVGVEEILCAHCGHDAAPCLPVRTVPCLRATAVRVFVGRAARLQPRTVLCERALVALRVAGAAEECTQFHHGGVPPCGSSAVLG